MDDITIARSIKLKNILDIAQDINISEDEIEQYGKYKAKIDLNILKRLESKSNGKLILVSAITPTKRGEGKSTVSIGLSQGLNLIGKNQLLH